MLDYLVGKRKEESQNAQHFKNNSFCCENVLFFLIFEDGKKSYPEKTNSIGMDHCVMHSTGADKHCHIESSNYL